MGEFNPFFSFDIGTAADEFQAPWEFKGALKQAEATRGTTIDYKIQKQLTAKQQRAQARKAPIEVPSSSEEEEEEDKDDSDVSGSEGEEEDAPLPGEIDEESGSEEEEEEEEESGSEVEADEEEDESAEEEEEEEEEESSEEEERPVKASQQSRKLAAKADAAAAAAAEEADSDDEEEEEEFGSDEEDGGRAAKRQRGENGKTAAAQKKKAAGGGYFDAAPQGTTFAAASFSDLNLSRPLVRACAALGYSQPTPIQAACIPLALTGRDISGSAITGSGKTAAFSLPLLERLLHRNKRVNATYVLVLAPTRELAVQVHSMIEKLAQFTDIRAVLVVGGLSLQSQAAALRASPEIVVATPGRLIDHLRNTQAFGLEDLAALVLDEADRLLEMGFAEEIREIVRMAPTKRQTLLFSATMTEEVKALVALSLRHPVRLAADAAAASPSTLRQEVIRLKGAAAAHKEAALLALAARSFAQSGRCIVFFSTKQRAHRAKILFGLAGLPAAAELHGDMTQAARLEGLERFRKGEVAFLLATDVAARGLDILGVEIVVNYDCPRNLASYLHRVGRTARAGSKGLSVTFAEDSDRTLLKDLVKKGGVALQQRKVAAPVVAEWQRKVEGMDPLVRQIFAEEGEEKELRKAEMEAAKAANMIEHEAEIYSRPPRTWFQSEKQKKETAARARAWEVDGTGEEEGGGGEGDGLSATVKKKIEKNAAKSDRRMERKINAAKEEKEKKRGRNALMEDTEDTVRRVKAVKAREAALRQEGMPAGRAGKAAAAMMAGVKKKSKKKAGKKEAGGDGLFSGDGVAAKPSSAGPSRVYAGGARTGAPKAPSTRLAGAELKRMKRGGKGKGSFKSKSKHKRR